MLGHQDPKRSVFCGLSWPGWPEELLESMLARPDAQQRTCLGQESVRGHGGTILVPCGTAILQSEKEISQRPKLAGFFIPPRRRVTIPQRSTACKSAGAWEELGKNSKNTWHVPRSPYHDALFIYSFIYTHTIWIKSDTLPEKCFGELISPKHTGFYAGFRFCRVNFVSYRIEPSHTGVSFQP